MDTLNTVGTKLNTLLENNTVKSVVLLILALYSVFAAPALPNSVIRFFDTIVGKLLFLFLIAYVASRDVQVAILLSVAFLITLQVANKQFTENFSIMSDIENAYRRAADIKNQAAADIKGLATKAKDIAAGQTTESAPAETPPAPPTVDADPELTSCRKNLAAKEQQLTECQNKILHQQDDEVNNDNSADENEDEDEDEDDECAGDSNDTPCSKKDTIEGFSVSDGHYALANFI